MKEMGSEDNWLVTARYPCAYTFPHSTHFLRSQRKEMPSASRFGYLLRYYLQIKPLQSCCEA